MKKILFIMLTLIIFSCEDISEKITNYSYLEYMEDGWEAFVYKEWDLGKEIFNIGLLQDSENYSEAYCSYVDFYNKNEAEYFIKALDSTPFGNMIIKVELMNFS